MDGIAACLQEVWNETIDQSKIIFLRIQLCWTALVHFAHLHR